MARIDEIGHGSENIDGSDGSSRSDLVDRHDMSDGLRYFDGGVSQYKFGCSS